MSDGLGSISKIFGSRRSKGFSDIRTFFRTNEQAADYDTLGDCRDALQHGSDELALRQRLQGPDHRQTLTARAVRLSPMPSRQSVRRP